MIARLSSTRRDARPRRPRPARRRKITPYATSAELAGDLAEIGRSLAANGSAELARGRLRALHRAVDVFGFHLAGIDLRQNSDVHERVVAELSAPRRGSPGYTSLERDRSRRAAAGGAAKRQAACRSDFGLSAEAAPSLLSFVPPPRRIGSTARDRFRTT